MPRKKKRKRTPEEIQRQNETNKWKKLQRIILANFKEGDWHLILKYRKEERPEEYARAKKQREKFLRDVRKAFKEAGVVFKWIAITERGKKEQVLHHHMIIQDIATAELNTVQLVKKFWKYGHVQFVSLYEDGEYEKLAQYIVKAETKEEKKWASYSRSRNMVVPEAKREVKYCKKWRLEPQAPEGWYVVKESVVNGINPFNERPYQYYTIKKLRGGPEDG